MGSGRYFGDEARPTEKYNAPRGGERGLGQGGRWLGRGGRARRQDDLWGKPKTASQKEPSGKNQRDTEL